MLDGVLQSQDTSLALSLVTYVAVLLTHTHHHTLMEREACLVRMSSIKPVIVLQMCSHLVTGSANNGGEDSTWSVISGKSSLDQARAVVAHKSGNFLVVAHGWFSGWSVKETSRQGQRRREQEPKVLINTVSTLI